MRFLRTVLAPALFIGAHVLFLWISTNRFFQVNQVGLLERQGWPLNDLVSMTAFGAIWGLVVGFQRARREHTHACEVAELCTQMGFSYAPFALKEKWESLPVCETWRNGFDEMSGTIEGWNFRMVDMQPQFTMTRREAFESKTIAMVEIAGLPDFQMVPRGWGGGSTAWAGFCGIAFDGANESDPDRKKLIKAFEREFELIPLAAQHNLSAWGANASTKKIEQEEARVRPLFSVSLMALLLRYPWVGLQATKGKLAIWRGEHCLGAASRPEFLEAIAEICHGLAASSIVAEQPPPGTVARDRSLVRQVKRYWATMRGCIAGSSAGFFIGFFAYLFLLRFQQGAGNFGGPEFLLFFGCVSGGVLLGGVCGAILMIYLDRRFGRGKETPGPQS